MGSTGEFAVWRGFAPGDAQAAEKVGGELGASHGLAGFGAAEFQHVLAGGRGAEVVVESDDAMDVRTGQVQRFGNHAHRLVRHIAESFLQGMQDRQRGAGHGRMLVNDRTSQGGVPAAAGGRRRLACRAHGISQ